MTSAADWPAEDTVTAGDFDIDRAEHIVIRAAEAGEAVLALGDSLALARPETLERFRRVFRSLADLWHQIFSPETEPSAADSQPVSADS